MTACFCGCGRDVGGGVRGMNKKGRRTMGLLTKLRDAKARVDRRDAIRSPRKLLIYYIARKEGEGETVDEPPDPEDLYAWMGDEIDLMIGNGVELAVFWREVVHGDYVPPPGEAKELKKAWEQWVRTGKGMCSIVGIKIERGPVAALRGRV
jgi:hypothetical protein